MPTEIRELRSDADVLAGFPVMSQLRPHLSIDEYSAMVRRMQADGYRQAAVFKDDRAVAAAGFRILEMLNVGLHLYVDDLVTADVERSAGHGKALMGWLVDLAREAGCTAIDLDSGTHRRAAHRFYARERFEIVAFHFRRELDRTPRLPS